MSGEGTYICKLDEKVQKKAKDELNEDPKKRPAQIEAFRRWVKDQPHMNSRTGIRLDIVCICSIQL